MPIRILFPLIITIMCFGCESKGKGSKDMNYSYACLDSAVSGSDLNRTLEDAGNAIRDFAVDEGSITDKVQNDYGEAFHRDAIENKTFVLLNECIVGEG